MIVKDFNEEKLTARRVETSSWESVRLLLKNDGMGFSFHITTIHSGARLKMHYRNHLEAVTASLERVLSRTSRRMRSMSCDRASFTRSINMMLTCCVPRPNWS